MKTIPPTFVFISLLIIPILGNCFVQVAAQNSRSPDVYVGIDIAYGGAEEAQSLMDQVSPYTNFIVIGSYVAVTRETCQHAVDKGLSFMTTGIPLDINYSALPFTNTPDNLQD